MLRVPFDKHNKLNTRSGGGGAGEERLLGQVWQGEAQFGAKQGALPDQRGGGAPAGAGQQAPGECVGFLFV